MTKAIEMVSWCVFETTEKAKALGTWCSASQKREIGAAVMLNCAFAVAVSIISAAI